MNYKLLAIACVIVLLFSIEPALAQESSTSSVEELDIPRLIADSLRIFADVLENSVSIVEKSADLFEELFA